MVTLWKKLGIGIVLLTIVLGSVFAGGAGEDPDAPIPLKLFFPGDAKKDLEMVEAEIEKRCLEDGLNIDLNIVFLPYNDYASRFRVMAASGEEFDGGFQAEWMGFQDLIPQGAFYDITDMLEQYPTLRNIFSDAHLKACSYEGRVYGLPWTVVRSNRIAFVLRQDIAERYGLEESDITTFEDVEKLAEQIKKDYPDMIPIALRYGYAHNEERIFLNKMGYAQNLVDTYQVTYKLTDDELKFISLYDVPEYKEYFVTTMNRWYEKGFFASNPMVVVEDVKTQVASGKYASTFLSIGDLATMNNMVTGANPEWKGMKVFFMYPDEPMELRSATGNLFVVSSTSKHPETVLQFLNWLVSDRANWDLFIYGIEGVHYVLDENGKVCQPDGMKASENPYQDWQGQWCFWYEGYLRNTEAETDELIALTNKSNNMNVVPLKTDGLVFNTDSIRTELATVTSIRYHRHGSL